MKILGQEKEWADAVKLASVTSKDRNPVFANNVVWLIHNGYTPRMSDHQYQQGSLVLPPGWAKGDFYQSTNHWDSFGLSGYGTFIAR